MVQPVWSTPTIAAPRASSTDACQPASFESHSTLISAIAGAQVAIRCIYQVGNVPAGAWRYSPVWDASCSPPEGGCLSPFDDKVRRLGYPIVDRLCDAGGV